MNLTPEPRFLAYRSSRFSFRLLLLVLLAPLGLFAQALSTQESAIVRSVDQEAPAALALLESLVNINSGTMNTAGVQSVATRLEREFQSLGFTTRLIPMEAVGRGPSLVAEHKGRGKRVLLIGHMDTVFEPSSPFQKFARTGDSASGPGAVDMKGGIVIILSALKALRSAGALDGASITVFLTGDEELAGQPTEISRKDLIAAGKASDAALTFEAGITDDGKDYVTTARRGATMWELKVKATAAHSSGIFSKSTGDGAAYELSRILNEFHDTLREPNLTYSVGLVLSGSNIKIQPNGDASVSGKVNIVPGEAVALGDLRALSLEQLARVKTKMEAIVAHNLPATQAHITFQDEYPPMAPTPGNVALMNTLNEANRALGAPQVQALDPMERGAGDASFIAPYVDSLDGLGAVGSGTHTPAETVDLSLRPLQTKRAVLLIYRLTQAPSR